MSVGGLQKWPQELCLSNLIITIKYSMINSISVQQSIDAAAGEGQ